MKAKSGLAIMLLAMAGVLHAQEGPKVDYSADTVMETSEGAMKGKLYSSKGKERREFNQDGEKMIMIMRQDKKLVWMLMPEEKQYMEMKMPKEGRKDDLNGWKIEQTKVGSETVDGHATTKSKIVMTGPKNEKMAGFWWLTKDNIIVKMDAIAVDKGQKDRYKIENRNIKIGKIDPATFEIPAGYSALSMGGMMMGSMKDEGDKPAPKGKEKSGGFGLKDAMDMLK